MKNSIFKITIQILIILLGTSVFLGQYAHAQDQPFRLIVSGGILEGSLRQATEFDSTLIILVAGSGPTDRNGNQPQGGAATLRMLADSLEKHGVSTFRYDKRNIGKSAFSDLQEENLRFDTIVQDLVRWVDHWQQDGRFSTIILAGHSEGALVATLCASRRPAVNGMISLAGAGRPADQLIMKQLERQPEFVRVAADSLFRLVREEQPVEPPPFLMALFRPSVQPYMRSWIVFDPAEEIGRLDIPVMIVQGEQDLQIFPEDADRLEEAARKSSRLTISDMNHVLKLVGDMPDNIASYTDADRPLHPDLIFGLMNWLSQFNTE